MKRRSKLIVGGLGLALLTWGGFHLWMENSHIVDSVNIEPSRLDLMEDDKLEDKVPAFDPALVDSRFVVDGETEFELNASAAVLKLDIQETRSDEVELNRLYASYADAAEALEPLDEPVLPSINLVDGMAKQFDDGLMAAVSLWLLTDAMENEHSVARLVRDLRESSEPGSAAHDWCSVAGHFGGVVSLEDLTAGQRERVEGFQRNVDAKPLGFYTWTKELRSAWVFLKFLQQPMAASEAASVRAVLDSDSERRQLYRAANEWVRKVSAPSREPNVLAGGFHFLPAAGTKEDVLFERWFGRNGVPADAELMHVLIQAIRAGEIDLAPRANGGWYDQQVYALESFLLPGRGKEQAKLLLTKKYKQRLLEAFRAIITKRRETHIGFGKYALGFAMPQSIKPRLRVEPNPTYFLRMARSYRFVGEFLKTMLAASQEPAFGLRENGRRERPLTEDVVWMQRLFYGLHLVSCEDIGLRPFLEVEEVNRGEAMKVALSFLDDWQLYQDMRTDVRVSVPVMRQPSGFRLWCNLGVKAIKLKVSYARPPSLRAAGGEGEWQEAFAAEAAHYLLLVDEFAEVHRPEPMNRRELRAVCDRFETREEIVGALK